MWHCVCNWVEIKTFVLELTHPRFLINLKIISSSEVVSVVVFRLHDWTNCEKIHKSLDCTLLPLVGESEFYKVASQFSLCRVSFLFYKTAIAVQRQQQQHQLSTSLSASSRKTSNKLKKITLWFGNVSISDPIISLIFYFSEFFFSFFAFFSVSFYCCPLFPRPTRQLHSRKWENFKFNWKFIHGNNNWTQQHDVTMKNFHSMKIYKFSRTFQISRQLLYHQSYERFSIASRHLWPQPTTRQNKKYQFSSNVSWTRNNHYSDSAHQTQMQYIYFTIEKQHHRNMLWESQHIVYINYFFISSTALLNITFSYFSFFLVFLNGSFSDSCVVCWLNISHQSEKYHHINFHFHIHHFLALCTLSSRIILHIIEK